MYRKKVIIQVRWQWSKFLTIVPLFLTIVKVFDYYQRIRKITFLSKHLFFRKKTINLLTPFT